MNNSAMSFEITAEDGAARTGRMKFTRGEVRTPAFMPVGTYGTVKGLNPQQLHDIDADIILGNTFHLMLRPGTDIIQQHGDLHDFMGWSKPILTDSGGFQVFSLQGNSITEEGSKFKGPRLRKTIRKNLKNFKPLSLVIPPIFRF